MPDWLFEHAFWDFDWLDILVLGPCAAGLVLKFLFKLVTGSYKSSYKDNPDYTVGGNDNIHRNFWDYM